MRLDFTAPTELVAASAVVIQATLASERQVAISAPADATQGIALIRSFTVQRVFRGDNRVKDGADIDMRWGIKSIVPVGNGQTVVESNPAPAAVVGRSYVLFLTYLSQRDGSQVLGPAAEPSMAAVSADTLTFLVSGAYLDDLAEQGLGRDVPSAFDGITLDRLGSLIQADDAAKAAITARSSSGEQQAPRVAAFNQLVGELPQLKTPKEVEARAGALGLDGPGLNDPPFCHKVETTINMAIPQPVNLQCGIPVAPVTPLPAGASLQAP